MNQDDAKRHASNRQYYAALAHSDCAARRVGWRHTSDQHLRFAVCAEVDDLNGVKSVLDVGCGLGDLAPFLRHRGFEGDYLGVDLLEEMVEGARDRHPGEHFLCANLLDHPPLPHPRFDLVIACGTLSLRVDEHATFFNAMLQRLWSLTTGALVLVLPSTRARLLPGLAETFVCFDPPKLRAKLLQLSPSLVLREDFLATDIAAYIYRDRAPTLRRLKSDLPPEDAARLYLQRNLPAAALAILEAAPQLNAQGLLRRGQALRQIGSKDAARVAFERALALDPKLTEARLELEGI